MQIYPWMFWKYQCRYPIS